MRTFASVLCWLVAVVAGTAALPVTWVADHVADESGYVRLAHDLRDDEQLRAAVSDIVAADLVDDLGLPDALRDQVAQRLREVVARLDGLEGFDAAWDEMQRRSHALWFAGHRTPDQLEIDVAPLAALAAGGVAGQLPVELSTPDQMLVTVASAPPGLGAVETTPTWKTIALLAAGAGAVLCFVFARRRSSALAWIGVGALLVAGLSWVGARLVIPLALERVERGASALGQVLTDALSERFLASLDSWIQLVAIAGATALVVGVVIRLATGRE